MDRKEKMVLLTDDNISKELKLGFEWFRAEQKIVHDINLFAIVVNRNGKIRSDEDVVFYNNWSDPLHIVYFSDDHELLDDSEDDAIYIDLRNVTTDTKKIVVFATLYAAVEREQNFSQLAAFYMYNNFEMRKDQPFEFNDLPPTSLMLLCEIKRIQDGWGFIPTGIGYQGDLVRLLKDYGLDLE